MAGAVHVASLLVLVLLCAAWSAPAAAVATTTTGVVAAGIAGVAGNVQDAGLQVGRREARSDGKDEEEEESAVLEGEEDEDTTPAKQEGTTVAKVSRTDDFGSAFIASIAMILVSEVGDKTFFIAAILAMKHPRLVIFSGAISALALMTALSTALGVVLPALLPHYVTHVLSIVFFASFGLKMLREWYYMDPDEGQEELEETEGELKDLALEKPPLPEDVEAGKGSPVGNNLTTLQGLKNLLYLIFSPIFIQTFTLTFLAEWGDRSQITTIAMAAIQNPLGITVGGIVGHAICTSVAVLGGRLLATKISVKTVTLVGALLFLLFAFIDFMNPQS